MAGFVTRRVGDENKGRDASQVHPPGNLMAQERLGPGQGGDHCLGLLAIGFGPRLAAKGNAVDGGVSHVGADPNFSNGDGATLQIGVAEIPALDDPRQCMADFLADPKLTLARRAVFTALVHSKLRVADAGLFELAGDLLNIETFDPVTDLEVLILGEGHAALDAFLDLFNVVLETLQL